MLDFGAGAGVFVDVVGKNCYGVDINNINHPRIKENLEDVTERHDKFDFITLWGVLEHLPDPKHILKKLTTHLRDGGFVVMTTVNAEGVIPYYYKPPEHLSYWTERAFLLLADYCNLRVVKVEPYTMFQLGDIYLNRLLSRTPDNLIKYFSIELPKFVRIPTNEVFVVMKKSAR